MRHSQIFAGVNFEPMGPKAHMPYLSHATERLETMKEGIIIGEVSKDIQKRYKRIQQWCGYLSSMESMIGLLESKDTKVDAQCLETLRIRMNSIDKGMGLTSRTTNRVMSVECFKGNAESNLVIAKESMMSKLKAGAKFIVDKIVQFFKWIFKFLFESNKSVSKRAQHTVNEIKKLPDGVFPVKITKSPFSRKNSRTSDIERAGQYSLELLGNLIALTRHISEMLDGDLENILRDPDLRSVTNQWDRMLEQAVYAGNASSVVKFHKEVIYQDVIVVKDGRPESPSGEYTFELNPKELETVVNSLSDETQRIGANFSTRHIDDINKRIDAYVKSGEEVNSKNLLKVSSYLNAIVILFNGYTDVSNAIYDFCDGVVLKNDPTTNIMAED